LHFAGANVKIQKPFLSTFSKKAALRIRDVYPGYRILAFIYPGSNKKQGEKI
jgi:hypothetical protein